MTGDTVLVLTGLATLDAARESGLAALARPKDRRAATLLKSEPWIATSSIIVLADTSADGVAHAERLATDLARLTRRETWWAPEPAGDSLDLGAIVASAVSCPPPAPLTVSFADIVGEPLNWLVPDLLPVGKLVLVAGHPGGGKSTFTIEVAARVTRGEGMPDASSASAPAEVMFLSSEDDPHDTIQPRLVAAGAVLGRVWNMTVPTLDDLRAALDARPGVRLVVVDPIAAFMGGIDSHRDAAVRSFLAELVELARAKKVTILLVAHLNKSGEGHAMLRVGGSVGLVAIARIAWLLATDPEDPETRVLVPLKNNVGPNRGGWRFRLVPTTTDGPARIGFEAGRDMRDANEVLRVEVQGPESRSARDDAKAWLADELTNGPRPATELKDAADAAGISLRTLRRAQVDLGVNARRDGPGGSWRWHQRTDRPPPARDPRVGQGVQGGQGAALDCLDTLDALDALDASPRSEDGYPHPDEERAAIQAEAQEGEANDL